MAQPNAQAHHETFPLKHIVGYMISLVLTVIAFWMALGLHLFSQ